ncbi:MAG: class I SAM-dependent methyltransferase [Pseudomonadota bacterium]
MPSQVDATRIDGEDVHHDAPSDRQLNGLWNDEIMHSDVADLRDFYATPLGQVSRRLISRPIRKAWQGRSMETVIGLGFAAPYLGAFKADARRLGAMMPTRQGALVWPTKGPKQSVLADEEDLPLADNSVDALLVVHGLEMADRPQQMLREIWRVLAPEGQVIIVVPNRRGIWARTDSTPFGFGRPYSRGQLEQLLIDAMLLPKNWDYALYMPPLARNVFVRSSVAWERIGHRFASGFSGVLIVEASKEMSAPAGKLQRVRAMPDLLPVGKLVPRPKPISKDGHKQRF